MMYGRGYFSGGLGYNGCYYGSGFMNHYGWNIGIIIGALVILALLFYILVHNKKKVVVSQSSLEALNMKYVQGEISEEEYLKRKSVIDRG